MNLSKSDIEQMFIENPEIIHNFKDILNKILIEYQSPFRYDFNSVCVEILKTNSLVRFLENGMDRQIFFDMLLEHIPNEEKEDFIKQVENHPYNEI